MATLLRIPWDRKLFKLFVLHEEFLRFEGAVFQFASWVFQISQLLMQLMTAFRLTRAYFKNFSNPHTSENATWRDFEVLIFNGGRQNVRTILKSEVSRKCHSSAGNFIHDGLWKVANLEEHAMQTCTSRIWWVAMKTSYLHCPHRFVTFHVP
jgi:hypothetical protein